MLRHARSSCHHGHQLKENNLAAARNLYLNTKLNTKFDIIEIDFICRNGEFLAAHDYDMTDDLDTLEEWVAFVIQHQLILWIDLKDQNISIFFDHLSQIDVAALFNKLNALHQIYNNLHKYILIGCQYQHIYRQLVDYSNQHNNTFVLIKDCPRDLIYVIDTITPNNILDHFEDEIDAIVCEDIGLHPIVALDRKYLSHRVKEYLARRTARNVILYNFEPDELPPKDLSSNCHFIYQLNYY